MEKLGRGAPHKPDFGLCVLVRERAFAGCTEPDRMGFKRSHLFENRE